MPPGGNPPSDRKKPLPPPPFGGPRPPPAPTSNPPPAPPPQMQPPPQAAPPQMQPPPEARPQRSTSPPPQSPEPPTQPRPGRSTNPPPTMLGVEPAKLPPTPMAPVAGPTPPAPAPAPVAAPPMSPVSPHGPSTNSRLPLPAPDGVASPPPGGAQIEFPPLPEMSLKPDRPFLEFAQVSLKRALRVKIDPNEITPHERAALDHALVTAPSMRSFLAWRRSVLFGFASFLGLLIVLRAIEVFDKSYVQPGLREGAGGTLQGLNIVLLLVDAAFCGLCWWQWTKWTEWKKQRRLLTLGWLVFFLAPFVLYLYPLRTTLADGENEGEGVLFGMLFALQAIMVLAPRALALLPGVARSATVAKFLFPTSPVPGWLLVAVTPLYALFLLFILIIPYQVTGSGFFILALGGFLGAAYFVTKTALELRGPVDRDQIARILGRIRTGYYIAMGVGALFILVGLAELVDQLDMKGLTVVNLVGIALANIWILTLVGTDNLIANLEAGRHVEPFTTQGPGASAPPPPSPS